MEERKLTREEIALSMLNAMLASPASRDVVSALKEDLPSGRMEAPTLIAASFQMADEFIMRRDS